MPRPIPRDAPVTTAEGGGAVTPPPGRLFAMPTIDRAIVQVAVEERLDRQAHRPAGTTTRHPRTATRSPGWRPSGTTSRTRRPATPSRITWSSMRCCSSRLATYRSRLPGSRLRSSAVETMAPSAPVHVEAQHRLDQRVELRRGRPGAALSQRLAAAGQQLVDDHGHQVDEDVLLGRVVVVDPGHRQPRPARQVAGRGAVIAVLVERLQARHRGCAGTRPARSRASRTSAVAAAGVVGSHARVRVEGSSAHVSRRPPRSRERDERVERLGIVDGATVDHAVGVGALQDPLDRHLEALTGTRVRKPSATMITSSGTWRGEVRCRDPPADPTRPGPPASRVIGRHDEQRQPVAAVGALRRPRPARPSTSRQVADGLVDLRRPRAGPRGG